MTRSNEEPRAEKASLRSRFLAARAALPEPARADASAEISRRLATLPELGQVRAVLGFASFGAEVDLDPYLQGLLDRGAGVFLPWVDGDELGIARVRDLEADLAPGWAGVREPRASGRRPARPDRLDAVVVPGVAFDRSGHRLGYGGGHFDRLLARLGAGAVRVGVCFAAQLVESLPAETHDLAVQVVVTESELIRPRPRSWQEG